VAHSGIPPEVQALLLKHIQAVEQLEILLLLYRNHSRQWSAVEVARELRIATPSAEQRLADLQSRGFLSAKDGAPRLYSYQPATSDLDRAVSGLERAYDERRVTVLNLIFSKPLDNVRVFADAFRLRRDEDDD
jgi:hypothetical protein